MKFSTIFTAKYYTDIEADSKEAAYKIALEMQNTEGFINILEFERPFVMYPIGESGQDGKKDFESFFKNHPDVADVVQKSSELYQNVIFETFEKLKNIREQFADELKKCDITDIEQYGEIAKKYGTGLI